ncbi:MAG: diguanylate cyclase [Sulfurimonas sp.]|nr:MAG: diguanylate cyclase [Sulfurimonas sp.]
MLGNDIFNSMEMIVNSTGALVYVIDLENYEILYANERCKEEFGEVVGRVCYETLQKNEKSPCKFCPMQKDKSPLSYPLGTIFEWENKNSINGKHYVFNDRIVSWNDNKKVKIQVGIDITKQKTLEEKILKLANYDKLTGLVNRVLLKEFIQKSIQKSINTSTYNALLFIDLDNFKVVNDKAGHNIGDMLIVEASKRIQSAVLSDCIIARLGGDEFVVLLDTKESNKKLVIDKLKKTTQKILEKLANPYIIENYDFRISASIGIKLFNDDSSPVHNLMKYADSAMYNAKKSGRNTFCFFDSKLQKIMEDKIKLIDSLREAITDKSMSLYYQTQILSCDNLKIIGVEALVRWNHPVQGLVSPADFIPAAEESGLIVPLGEWIINEAVKQLKLWERDIVKKYWQMSINVSSKQFEKDNFIEMIKDILEKHEVNPNMIRLELTESLLIKNIDQVLDRLHKLKQMGLSLSIDDFGTGYSSLSYLKKLPIDELKIDQSFIKDLIKDSNDEIITQIIITMGQKFAIDVIAEGVETQEQYEKLLLMGCQYFQGYLFSKPVEANYL